MSKSTDFNGALFGCCASSGDTCKACCCMPCMVSGNSAKLDGNENFVFAATPAVHSRIEHKLKLVSVLDHQLWVTVWSHAVVLFAQKSKSPASWNSKRSLVIQAQLVKQWLKLNDKPIGFIWVVIITSIDSSLRLFDWFDLIESSVYGIACCANGINDSM